MRKYTKKFTPIYITPFLLSACGGETNNKSEISSDQDVISSIQINGKAVKGIIKNGKVSAFGLANGQINDLPLATTYTDSQGRYSLVLDNYNGPLFIEVSANSDTTMTCDIIDGCNGFLYGEDIPLDDEFSLKTAVSLNKSEKVVIANASVITTLAAELSENYNSIDEIVIQNANSQVANLLKINGDITKIDIIDIFSPTLGSDIDPEIKENSLLNPALISAALKIDQNKTISEGLNLLIDEFVKNDGQMVNHQINDGQDVTLSNVFDEAYNLASRDSRFNDIKINFMLSKENSILSSGEYTKAIPNKFHKMEDVEHAKDLIAKLKDLHQQLSIEDTQYPSAVAQLNLLSSFPRDKNFQALPILIKKASRGFLSAFDANKIELEQKNIHLNQYVHTEIDGSIYTIKITKTKNDYIYQLDSSVILSGSDNTVVNYNLTAEISATEPEVNTIFGGLRFNDLNDPHDLALNFDEEREIETTFSSATSRNSINYELNISGELTSPYYNLKILDGDIDAIKYIDLSAWFNGGISNSQENFSVPEDQSTPLFYREVSQVDDVAIGEGLTLNLDLDVEANQVNYDNSISFIGNISVEEKNQDSYALFSRYQAVDYQLPILILGMDPENATVPDDLNSTYEERPVYKDEIVLSGMIDESFMKLSGELKQGKNSVNGIFTSSGNIQRDSWSGMSYPVDISDLLDGNTMSGHFDSISGGEYSQAQATSFFSTLEELTAKASTYPEIENLADTNSQPFSEIILNKWDHSLIRTIKDLLQLSNFSTAKYESDPDYINNEIDRGYYAGNSEYMLAMGLNLEDDSISDINEIFITKSDGMNKNYSVDIKFNSENIDFDITHHDILNELVQFGSDREFYENLVFYDHPNYVFGQPFLSRGENPFHDLLYDKERYQYQIPKLTVTNQNNTVLQLFEKCPELVLNCEQLGTITVKGNTVANIVYDYVNNNYIVNFNDGTFETL